MLYLDYLSDGYRFVWEARDPVCSRCLSLCFVCFYCILAQVGFICLIFPWTSWLECDVWLWQVPGPIHYYMHFYKRHIWCYFETDRGYLFFQCKIEFDFTEGIPKVVVSRVEVAKSEIRVLVFMSEIKSDIILKKSSFLFNWKIKFSVSFMLLFIIIKLLPHARKPIFFYLFRVCLVLFSVFRGV